MGVLAGVSRRASVSQRLQNLQRQRIFTTTLPASLSVGVHQMGQTNANLNHDGARFFSLGHDRIVSLPNPQFSPSSAGLDNVGSNRTKYAIFYLTCPGVEIEQLHESKWPIGRRSVKLAAGKQVAASDATGQQYHLHGARLGGTNDAAERHL